MLTKTLSNSDPEMAAALNDELTRQRDNLVMIPSENYASRAVLQAQGSVLTNKYAEGYPGARWYNGCKAADRAEQLAIDRAKELFGADHVNVQAHTGSQANMAAYFGLLDRDDTILSLSVDQGGHLTHGQARNFSSQYYKIHHYSLNRDTETLDYDALRKVAHTYRPKLIVIGFSAYPRIIDWEACRSIADEVDALMMTDVAHIVGLIAAGLHPSPVPYADVVTSTTHKTLRGPRGAFIMCKRHFAEAIDRAIFPGIQAGPLMHVIAAKAVAFKEAQSEEFREYQKQILKNAQALAEGLLAEGIRLVSGGTETHLMLCDLRSLEITGRDAANLLEEAHIIVNKNAIPFDNQPPAIASGIRPGTPALTSRGMKEPEMKQIAKLIGRVLKSPQEASVRAEVSKEVLGICAKFPVYEDLIIE